MVGLENTRKANIARWLGNETKKKTPNLKEMEYITWVEAKKNKEKIGKKASELLGSNGW